MATASSYLLSPRELAAWRGMLETHSRLIAELDAELEREHDLPLSAYEVLMYLGDTESGRMRMSELADHLLLSRSGITRLADRLERRGLIERERCSDDGRGFFAQLTPAGRGKLERARPSHLAAVRRVFLARLEPGEIETLASVWGRLLVQTGAGDLDEAV
jgi:DNA-binding MarR family transcriptional regulator